MHGRLLHPLLVQVAWSPAVPTERHEANQQQVDPSHRPPARHISEQTNNGEEGRRKKATETEKKSSRAGAPRTSENDARDSHPHSPARGAVYSIPPDQHLPGAIR